MPPGTLLRALCAVQKRVHDPAARWNAESFPGLLTYLTVAKTVQKEQAGTGQQMKEAEERQKMAMLKADRLAQDTTSPDEKVQRNIPTHARRLHDIRRQAVKPLSQFLRLIQLTCLHACKQPVSPEKKSAGASAAIGNVEEKTQQGKFQNFLLLGCSLAAVCIHVANV